VKTSRLFLSLPPLLQEKLRPLVRMRHFQAGEMIFLQEDPSEAIYFVEEGRVKIARVSPEGEETILCIRHPGEYFCPVPLLDGKGQLGTAFALTPVTILSIERQVFLELAREHPELLAIVQADCLKEVRYLLHRLEAFSRFSVRERVISGLLDALQPASENRAIVWLTHQELANLIGASRENVSRTLKELEKEGLIRLCRGKIEILNVPQLSARLSVPREPLPMLCMRNERTHLAIADR
jgi:CRP-like cAMP-binding protein